VRNPVIPSHHLRRRAAIWLITAGAVISLLALASQGRAQGQSVVACTPQSMDAYQQLAARMHPGGDFPTAALGKVVDQTTNPVITLRQSNQPTLPGAYDYADDPSCGLASALAACHPQRARPARASTSLCGMLRTHAVIGFVRPLAHRTALTIYHRVGSAHPASRWRLVQNSLLPHDAALSMQSKETLRIEFAQHTVHQLWRWQDDAFAPVKSWRTIWVWHAGRYVSRPLERDGELPRANPDCAISLVHRLLDQAGEQWLHQAASNPPIYLYCGHLAGEGNLQELAFALWDTPSVGDMPWLLFGKDSRGRWVAEDEPYVLVGALSCLAPMHKGFVTSDQVWDDDPGCHGLSPCYRFERHHWTGRYYIVSSTSFGARPDPACNHGR
jgi:hypothetical protein